MIATGVLIDLRRAAKLGGEDDQRVLEQTATLEISEQRTESPIKLADLLRQACIDVVVHVPATQADFDKAHTVLDEAAGKQATLTKAAVTVLGLNFIRLLTEIKGGEVCTFHDAHSVLVDVGIGADGAVLVGFLKAGVELGREIKTIVKITLIERGDPLAVLKTGARIV